jgi:hypothetical protein
MMENEFNIDSLSKFLERCENEPFPGQIDWDINILERFTRNRSLDNMEIFPLVWLYRKTKASR